MIFHGWIYWLLFAFAALRLLQGIFRGENASGTGGLKDATIISWLLVFDQLGYGPYYSGTVVIGGLVLYYWGQYKLKRKLAAHGLDVK